jgi:hypothetical protein
MRTTLEIDDDVLQAVKELAAGRNVTAGQVISELVREALTRPPADASRSRNGFPLLPRTRAVVTPQLVGKLLKDDV